MATQSTPPGPQGFAPHPEHRRRGRDCGRVLVLNATYEPINVCTVRRAAVLLLKEKADTHRRKITRRAVFARDGWACQYCGARANLTVDHVIPRSKGGPSTWENIVASCAPCNRRKGDHLPHKVGMHPRQAPRVPHPQVFIHVASPTIPPAWRQWLPEAA
jgi:5-methylcytosine-specific restriction endonuclease McrA